MSEQTPAPPGETFAAAFRRARSMDASVNERLRVIAETVRRLAPDFASAVDTLIERLKTTGAGAEAPAVGDKMPPFMLPDETGKLVSLESLLAGGPVAVAFHRGSWCPYCRLNTITLAEAAAEATKIGGQIVAITKDPRSFSIELKSDASAPFPILTDVDSGYAMSLNLAIWVGVDVYGATRRFTAGDARFTDDHLSMLPIPATFVLDRSGTIRARFVDPDYRRRMEIDELLRALKAARD